MDLFLKILFLVLSYFVGAIPFGYIFGKIKGHDLRKEGSNNIGATNAGRILGKKYAVFTYILDMLKGAVFVFLFKFCIIPLKYCVLSPMLYGLIAVLGHTFPIYLGFKGGKSVSCGCGAVAGYCPMLLPFLLLVFFIFKKVSKLVSFSSLLSTIAGILAVLAVCLISGQFTMGLYENTSSAFAPNNYWYFIFTCIISAIIYIRHYQNIIRIFNHTEKPINY